VNQPNVFGASMIEQITIRGFRSLADVTVDFAPVTVLIGKSGSGKTNFMEAIRFLRDELLSNSHQQLVHTRGGWPNVHTVTHASGQPLSFRVRFRIIGFPHQFLYELSLDPIQLLSEALYLGENILFHKENGNWKVAPNVAVAPNPSQIALATIAGIQEVSLAYSSLTGGLGCYRFSDRVLDKSDAPGENVSRAGLNDRAVNYLDSYAGIYTDVQYWKSLKQIEAAMRKMKPSLASITINQPGNHSISTALEIAGHPRLTFDIAQESEGFRRLFACLLALYQRPSKQTLLFDEPEKGIHPSALGLLAEEFHACAELGRGQVILTTHSPEFLDHFQPEEIRVVEMKNYETQIGGMDGGQKEAIKEQFLRPGELLTVDEARIQEPAAAEMAQ
jgi:AAA domain, putative AbiEii toxin, Type IV TA system/AAA ATPase domain